MGFGSAWHTFWARRRETLQAKRWEADMQAEMGAHVRHEMDRNIEAGMTRAEAEREARQRLGSSDRYRESARDQRGGIRLEQWMRSLQFALRQLMKSPGFTVVAVVTLALGIGMNTAMFSMLNGLLLRPLSFPETGRLFRLERNTPEQFRTDHTGGNFLDIREASTDVAEVAVLRGWAMSLDPPDGPPEALHVARVTANLFDVLGVKPLHGRTFRLEEEVSGQDNVIAIGYEYWLSRFGGREDVVGSMVRLDKRSVEIVAVMPPMPDVNRINRILGNESQPIPVYVPIGFLGFEQNARGGGKVQVIGRLHPGVGLPQAQARFDTIAADLARRFPDGNSGAGLEVRPLQETVLDGSNRTVTFLLIGLSGFVLLIACANLANLLLARSMARAREFSICAALGASRAQLTRPIVAECLVLAGAGLVGSLLVAFGTARWLAQRFGSPRVPVDFSPDWRVLAFAGGVATVTALLFGLAPAWWASRRAPGDALKNDARSMSGDRSHRGYRELLIIGQFALALVLLAGAGVFVRGIERLRHGDLGWQPERLLTATINLQDEQVTWGPPRVAFHDGLREQLMAIPGVENAAIVNQLSALYSNLTLEVLRWTGDPTGADSDTFMTYQRIVTPSYFDTVGARLLGGRNFDERDHARSLPVALIGQSMAERMFAGEDPIGQFIGFKAGGGQVGGMEVIGVVADTRPIEAQASGIAFELYRPYAQITLEAMRLSVKAANPEMVPSLVDPVRRTIADYSPYLAVSDILPMTEVIAGQTKLWETVNQLLLLFAGLGVSLAALGVYGVVSRMIALRTSEFGIRMAVGAQARDILRLVLGGHLRTVLLGAALGLAGAVVLSRYLASELPVFAEGGGAVMAAAVAALFLVALLACLVPARRATRIDPVVALRNE